MAKEIILDGWQKLALVKEKHIVQIQVDNDGDESYVNLPLHEVKKLIESLEQWVKEVTEIRPPKSEIDDF